MNSKLAYLTPVLKRISPWVAFWALWSWSWTIINPFLNIPAYGDSLEVLWAIEWYGEHFLTPGFWTYSKIFYPGGWHIGTFAHTPAMLIALIPFYRLGGAAFAYNICTTISFIVAFAGAYRLARQLKLPHFYAILSALLFTFWDFRWFRINGHLHVLWGSSFLPWMAFYLNQAHRAPAGKAYRPVILAGVFWALSIYSQLYFLWIGGFIVLGWMLGQIKNLRAEWKAFARNLILITGIALLLSSPIVGIFLTADKASNTQFFDIYGIIPWGASLNSLPIPTLFHSWLTPLSRKIFQGALAESTAANLGLAAVLLALLGLWNSRRDSRWRPARILLVVGVVFSLGYFLYWNGRPLHWAGFRPINGAIWQIGYTFKPQLFADRTPIPDYQDAIPLPGLIMAAVIPFWEGARTLSRYIFISAIVFFPLAIQGIRQLRWRPLQILMAGILIFEGLPFHSGNVPAEPPVHPAYAWIAENSPADSVLIDLYAPAPHFLTSKIGGEILWSTRLHQRATVSGAGSFFPATTNLLTSWIGQHPDPFLEPNFIPLLRYYQTRYIVLHQVNAHTEEQLAQARQNPALHDIGCFAPPENTSPWGYPICILEIRPPSEPEVNFILQEGWSNAETWGMWAEKTISRAQWVNPQAGNAVLSLSAFPNCIPDSPQSITVRINDRELTTYHWPNCDPWTAELSIPAAWLDLGWNSLTFEYGFARLPQDPVTGVPIDTRTLAAGFTRLQIHSEQP